MCLGICVFKSQSTYWFCVAQIAHWVRRHAWGAEGCEFIFWQKHEGYPEDEISKLDCCLACG